jgi:hypothetical protein
LGLSRPPSHDPCSARHTRTAVASFLRNFNSGALRLLNHAIAREPDFAWYSVTGNPGERLNEKATNRSSLVAYFAARHAHHERLTLRSFKFNGKNGGYGNFQYQLIRQADDLTNGSPVPYDGKGSLNCRVRRIAVWSMGPR